MRRCAVHPCKGCRAQTSTPALEAAADRTVILSWWQLRDHIADHGFWSGLKYRFASLFLRGAYRRAGERLPRFDAAVRLHLQALAALEDARCASIDMAAEPFAALMADAAADLTDEKRRRILGQILYQLGRWIYLIDAADDLKKDVKSGSYNPLVYRFHAECGTLTAEDRAALAATLDSSVRAMAAAFELADFGPWRAIIESVVYEGLYAVGAAVLNGTFRKGHRRKQRKAGA